MKLWIRVETGRRNGALQRLLGRLTGARGGAHSYGAALVGISKRRRRDER